MSAENFIAQLKTLESCSSDLEASRDILGRIFDVCSNICNLIENSDLASSSKEIEDAIDICIKYLEKCTTMVNELELFSSNEAIEEIETASIKYLLLPAFLGSLNLSRQSKDLSKRVQFLETAEVYFQDFLFRCKNYEISKNKSVINFEDQLLEESTDDESGFKSQSIAALTAQRENKIRMYKLKKELKTREEELKPALKRPDAEEYIREYYIVLIEKWIITAIEEIKNIKSEKSVVQGMVKADKESLNVSNKPKKVKPLKPLIITKNEIQKKVFGLGYPSIPVMTVDDFYRQRFEKMVKERENFSNKTLQDSAFKGEAVSKEDEDIQKEELLQRDDPEALLKARAWDDWKDENPRGAGNRYNKG